MRLHILNKLLVKNKAIGAPIKSEKSVMVVIIIKIRHDYNTNYVVLSNLIMEMVMELGQLKRGGQKSKH